MSRRISNNLLLDDRSIVLLPQLACMVGVNEAIFLQQIHYFNKDKDIHSDWFTCSLDFLHKKYFSFWSIATLRRIKDRLVKAGYIQIKKLRCNNGDHTLSYRVNKEKLVDDLYQKETHFSGVKMVTGTPPSNDLPLKKNIDTLPPTSETIQVSEGDLPQENQINEATKKNNPSSTDIPTDIPLRKPRRGYGYQTQKPSSLPEVIGRMFSLPQEESVDDLRRRQLVELGQRKDLIR